MNVLLHFLVYKDSGFGYIGIVRDLAKKSKEDARREVEVTPNYTANGDVSKLTHRNQRDNNTA